MKSKKQKIFFVLLVLVYCFVLSPVIGWSQTETDDKENNEYGTLEGQVLDANTGEPVNEEFYIKIYDCNNQLEPKYVGHLFSDEKGQFKRFLVPGKYYFEIHPMSETSKYNFGVMFRPGEDPLAPGQIVSIKEGQILKIVRKAERSGRVLIRVVDENGNPFDFKKQFGVNAGINTIFSNSKYGAFHDPLHQTSENNPELKNNEFLFFRIWPGEVRIELSLPIVGYMRKEIVLLDVKAGQMHEVNFVIQLNNTTIITGLVTTLSGKPVEGAIVLIGDNNNSRRSAVTYTDKMANIHFLFSMRGNLIYLSRRL